MKSVYKDAFKAAYGALSRETTAHIDPALKQLSEEVQSVAARGAKIRADTAAAKSAAAIAVARAVADKIAAEESARADTTEK